MSSMDEIQKRLKQFENRPELVLLVATNNKELLFFLKKTKYLWILKVYANLEQNEI